MADRIESDQVFTGAVSFKGTTTLPANCVSDSQVLAGSNVDADKLQHRFAQQYSQADGADVASETRIIHIARFDGNAVELEVCPTTAPTGGGDKQFTVDLQKSTGAGAFATVLSAVITLADADTDRVVKSATPNSAAYVAGDVFRIVVTASGSSGSQGQGVGVVATFDENSA